MSSNPNDPTSGRSFRDPALEDAPGQSSAHATPADEDDTEPVDASAGRGDPTGPYADLPGHSDEDQIKQPTDFADEGYDDRQRDATRAAATERGDFGPATTEPSDRATTEPSDR
jgi:hypothetical protein